MKITKHGHACLVLEEGSTKVVLDPGVYTAPMEGLHHVVAVVITHIHDDHCSEEQLDRIAATNPSVKIFGTDEVAKRLAASRPDLDVTPVHHGDLYSVGDFRIEFFGDMHAEIHRSIPLVQNCGVMFNDKLYYPGDSFTRPDRPVELLAVPASAPWLKISEVIDFVAEVAPKRSFATHNIHLSDFGNDLNNGRIKATTEAGGGTFEFLKPGESTEV